MAAIIFDNQEKEIIFSKRGFSKKLKLSLKELKELRDLVSNQYHNVISENNPELVESAKKLGIENYHKISSKLEHTKIWPKKNRCLPQESCDKIKCLPFWSLLKEEFGPFMSGRVVYEKEVEWDRDEMYWRIVRPNESSDVGTLHADSWWHNTMKVRERTFPKGAHALKVWIPLYVEAGKNGLLISPESHKKSWDYQGVEIENTYKPRLSKEVEESTEVELLYTEPGEVVIFNQDLVHVGALNKGDTTRLSLEITMILERQYVDPFGGS